LAKNKIAPKIKIACFMAVLVFVRTGSTKTMPSKNQIPYLKLINKFATVGILSRDATNIHNFE